MKLDLGRWATTRFDGGDVPTIAGISGGETSGLMGALCDRSVVLCYQNTGKEAGRTLEFLGELADALEREVTWLEFRPPRRMGDQPCKSRFDVVTFTSADRSGAPFEMLMATLNAFRHANGKGPIAPWWRSRICTTYMKTRTARNWVNGQGWTAWNELVGLRADEQSRVARLRVGVPKRIGRYAPLSDAGITKADVREFWDRQPFKLGLDPLMGNCTGCFLKDQADLSRALKRAGDVDWWAGMEDKYPGWGGRNFAGYRRLRSEADARERIEAGLRAGACPANDSDIPDPKRFKLVVIQERKRLAGQVLPFACGCEGSDQMALLDTEEEEKFILSLPDANELEEQEERLWREGAA